MGSTLGVVWRNASWPAAQCRDRPNVFRHQHSIALGRRYRAGQAIPSLAHFQAGAVAWRMRAKGRKGHDGGLRRYVCSQGRAGKGQHVGRRSPRVGFLKRFTAFHVDQCDGLPPEAAPVPLPGHAQSLPNVEAVIAATGADFRIGGGMAFYSPLYDFIQVPPQEAYFEPINWYRTKLHELGHWTGHASRLDRNFSGRFSNEVYAREELVAELCSAFLCAELGVAPTVRHADYLGAWLDVLKGDNRAIFQAVSLASRAAAYITAFGRTSVDAANG